MLYPTSAGTFPLDHSAPPELLEVGVARYTNSVCACDASWSVNRDGEWIDVDPATLCLAILEYDDDCGGCCTRNASETGFLIDMEINTATRFGSNHGIVDWACLDC